MSASRVVLGRRSRTFAIAFAVAIVVAVGAACSIRPETAPRDIVADGTFSGDSTPALPRPGTDAEIFLLEQEPSTLLHPVGRSTKLAVADVVRALFEGPGESEGANERLRTAIPLGMELRDASVVNGGVAIIDVSDELTTVRDELLIDALAQIVFTATEVPGVEAVRLTVDGKPRQWLISGDSASTDMTRFDFPERNPSSQPDFPSVPGG